MSAKLSVNAKERNTVFRDLWYKNIESFDRRSKQEFYGVVKKRVFGGHKSGAYKLYNRLRGQSFLKEKEAKKLAELFFEFFGLKIDYRTLLTPFDYEKKV